MTSPLPADASRCAEGCEADAGAVSSAEAPMAAEAQTPATVSDDELIVALEAEVAAFTRDIAACEQEVRRLMAAENIAEGVYFAKELHAARQKKMCLTTEIHLRRVKINRLRLGILESVPPNIAKGFPF